MTSSVSRQPVSVKLTEVTPADALASSRAFFPDWMDQLEGMRTAVLGLATIAVALDGAEVTGAPEGYGLGNAETVTVFFVVVVTLSVWHSYEIEAPAPKGFVGMGTTPPQSVCASASVASSVVSGTVPVLVTKTRHRAVVWVSVPLGAQSTPVSGWVGSHEVWLGRMQIWSTAEMAALGGGVADATWAVPVAGTEVTGDPDDGVPVTVTVCVSVVGGVTPVVWQTYPYDAPAAREFPGTGTDPAQSVAGNGRELLALMLVSGSAPVLVTTTRHHTSEPYTVADEAQSAPLSGWVGSQEGPTGSVHTCTTAETESVAADATVGVHTSSANNGNMSPAASDSRIRGAEPRLKVIPFLLRT